jgi:hypothetical protein
MGQLCFFFFFVLFPFSLSMLDLFCLLAITLAREVLSKKETPSLYQQTPLTNLPFPQIPPLVNSFWHCLSVLFIAFYQLWSLFWLLFSLRFALLCCAFAIVPVLIYVLS